MTLERSRLQAVPGESVRFVDGSPVGTVSRVAELSFQVTAGELVFWVRHEAILRRHDGAIVLCCDVDGLPAWAGAPARLRPERVSAPGRLLRR